MEEIVAIAHTAAVAERARRAVSTTTVLVAGEETGGRFAIVEMRGFGDTAAPCHIHSREDEVVYVLAGRVRVQIDEAISHAEAGQCLVLARGCEHAILAESPEAHLLLITLPAGIEGYYRELAFAPEDEPDGVERLIAIAARYGVTITGPSAIVSA